MATVGNTTTPATSFHFVSSGTDQFCSPFTMPSPGGMLSTLHAYFSTETTAGTCYVCLWDGSGNLLGSVNIGSVPTGSNAIGGQAWRQGTLASPIFVAGGATIYIGFWVPTGSGAVWTDEGSGSTVGNTQTSGPASLAGNTGQSGTALGAYADYTPGNVYVWNGSIWVAGTPQVWNGSSWVAGVAYVWNGSSWVQGA